MSGKDGKLFKNIGLADCRLDHVGNFAITKTILYPPTIEILKNGLVVFVPKLPNATYAFSLNKITRSLRIEISLQSILQILLKQQIFLMTFHKMT